MAKFSVRKFVRSYLSGNTMIDQNCIGDMLTDMIEQEFKKIKVIYGSNNPRDDYKFSITYNGKTYNFMVREVGSGYIFGEYSGSDFKDNGLLYNEYYYERPSQRTMEIICLAEDLYDWILKIL